MVNEYCDIDFLYHYTSIETLELILKNKTIRFSSLSVVDDMEEASTKDYGEFGKFCFVSSWTSDAKESIPLWNMYTPNMSGIRIKLPVNPFKTDLLTENNKFEILGKVANRFDICDPIPINTKLYKDVRHIDYIINPPIPKLKKIIYTDSLDKLNPLVYIERYKEKGILFTDIGVYKGTQWDFQKEFRYVFLVLPLTYDDLVPKREYIDRNLIKLKSEKLSKNFFDVDLSDSSLDDIEILIGPKATQYDKLLVRNLVNSFNPNLKVCDSSLKIR